MPISPSNTFLAVTAVFLKLFDSPKSTIKTLCGFFWFPKRIFSGLRSLWTNPRSCNSFNLKMHWYPIRFISTRLILLLFITSYKLSPRRVMTKHPFSLFFYFILANPSLLSISVRISVSRLTKAAEFSTLFFLITSIHEVYVLNTLKTSPNAPSPILSIIS